MREVHDHYFKQARREGYRSRAAYKLIDIDDRKKVIRRGARVLDVGAAPGSWCQVLAKRVGPRGVVVGFDLKPIDASGLAEHVRVFEADANAVDLEELGGHPFDAIVSDMAPDTTGDPFGDHHRSVRLCEMLLARCGAWLKPGGNLIMKVFEGEAYRNLLEQTSNVFEKAKGFKPAASRAESVEMFIVAHGYKGPDKDAPPDERDALPTRRPSRGWS